MRRAAIALLFSAVLVGGFSAPAFAAAQPPTNAGNGAGQSGQCTGPVDERPHSCQAYK
jgi:hypothetical protein